MGEEIHAEITKQGLLAKSVVLGTALVDMYAKCGAVSKAREVFDKLLTRNTVSWNVLIAGYAQNGSSEEALACFSAMKKEGFSPNAATFACVLKACGKLESSESMGEEIHAQLSDGGWLENNLVLGNALVDMYAKRGRIAKAQNV
jgi:pentatricopeptide repeat protein